jgi:predicted metal-dependent RNase
MKKRKTDTKVKVQFVGATEEITGSCTYVQIDGLNILVDFGMIQNQEFNIDQFVNLLCRVSAPAPTRDQAPMRTSSCPYLR